MARPGAAPPTRLLSALRVLLAVLVLAGVLLGGWIGWFYARSHVQGAQLLAAAQHLVGSAPTAHARRVCTPPPSGAAGELAVPSLGLVAPVVQGDGDGQLAVAVGHVPTSRWPGQGGTSVLVAHDVTWFHELDHLHRGAEVEFLSGCRAIAYRVDRGGVVAEGSAVPDTPGHLALVTCWPLDALWFTGQRYLVQATEVGGALHAPPVRLPAPPPVPPTAVPATLAPVATLAANPTPLGPLHLSGRPSRSFEESPGPLADAGAAQSLFFATQRAAEAGDATGWAAVAPGVPLAEAGDLVGSAVSGFGGSLRTTLSVQGRHLTGATVRVAEALRGPSSTTTWTVTATERLVSGQLAVTGWVMAQS